jgi:hypothetical protein
VKLWIKLCTAPRQVVNLRATGIGQGFHGYKTLIILVILGLYSYGQALIIIVIILI